MGKSNIQKKMAARRIPSQGRIQNFGRGGGHIAKKLAAIGGLPGLEMYHRPQSQYRDSDVYSHKGAVYNTILILVFLFYQIIPVRRLLPSFVRSRSLPCSLV